MDGLAAVTARVNQIQGLVASLQHVRPATSVLGVSATSSGVSTGSSTAGASLAAARGTSGAGSPAGASFDAALTQARASTPGSRALDADGVPVELARYGNGKVPSDALASIGVGNHRLWAPAAEAFTELRAAAKAAGVTIGVTDSYRSYEAQVDVARRKGLYKDGGLAAVPGTSQHGWGMALDLDLDSKAQTWMRANAGRFGFVEDVPREPWHWAFSP